MTYIGIDTSKKQAAAFLEYLKTLPFVTIYEEPNAVTKKAMAEVRQGNGKKHKSVKALIDYLNK